MPQIWQLPKVIRFSSIFQIQGGAFPVICPVSSLGVWASARAPLPFQDICVMLESRRAGSPTTPQQWSVGPWWSVACSREFGRRLRFSEQGIEPPQEEQWGLQTERRNRSARIHCTYAGLGHDCTSHVPHICFRAWVSPWQTHPVQKKICRLFCCLQTSPAFL